MTAQEATSRPSPEELRGAALEYAARGVPVLPLRGKLPRIAAAHRLGDPSTGSAKAAAAGKATASMTPAPTWSRSATGGTAGLTRTSGCAPA